MKILKINIEINGTRFLVKLFKRIIYKRGLSIVNHFFFFSLGAYIVPSPSVVKELKLKSKLKNEVVSK